MRNLDQQINIGGHTFWGYYTLDHNFNRAGGVYVILDGQQIRPVDVGQTDDLSIRLDVVTKEKNVGEDIA